MKTFRVWFCSVIATLSAILPVPARSGELAVLSETTWDEFVPRGKEVDAIYGDFVLRNDKIVVVIANPVPGRNANMTVKDVGGAIIDLTVRDRQSDQLSAYYPGARRYPYQLVEVGAEGKPSAGGEGRTDRTVVRAADGKLDGGMGVLRRDTVFVQCMAPAAADRPEVRLTYTLRQGQAFVEIHTEFSNSSPGALKVTPVDDFRADRTFQTAPPGLCDLAWFHDRWWGQAYGVMGVNQKLRLTGSPADPRVVEFLSGDQPTVELEAGGKLEITRYLVAATDLLELRRLHDAYSKHKPKTSPGELVVKAADGKPVARADVELRLDGAMFGHARTGDDGKVSLQLMPGKYTASVSTPARGSNDVTFEATTKPSGQQQITMELPLSARVVAEISDADSKPVPCKVQFAGVEGTKDPFFFPDTGEHAVHNLYYSHDGRFTQEIPPGKYDVLISYGPEYNVEKLRIEAKPGAHVPLKATLQRVVQSPGWVSTDFHGHSSPSGDNVSSQLGRVLNLLCEHIEFAPCTEHNRLDTYVPHLKALGAEHLMGTCTGIELTGSLGTINHQNAFPLVRKPRTQDGGAPLTDANPEEQIKRLALWDNNSDKLVQQNHPDIGEMFFDRDGDGKPDGGYKGMFAYQDVIEVHPIHEVLSMDPYRLNTVVNKQTNEKTTTRYNHTIVNWLQLLNQGRRLPGVVNTDAHYNFHGSGYIRNYVKCETDDPSKIDPMDIVHAAEKGHIIMTNGPYLEVTLYDAEAGGAAVGGTRRKAIPGDDLPLPGGFGSLHVRVQCPNWFDIDRVQVLLNGRKDDKLNWTRSANPDAFADGVVKFDRRIPIEFQTDTHVIVVATGEKTQIGPVMGPDHGKRQPTAISNPILVDADGGGFKANGDTLGIPLPVKGGQKVDPPPQR